MNNESFSSSLMRYKKKDIIKLLRKEGIEPNEKQGKEELIKLLNLAKKANEPSRIANRRLIRGRSIQPFLLVILTFLVFVTVFSLYKFNPTFSRNVNFLVSLMEVENLNTENPNEPKILEKNGKTYVVYNHPLVSVETFYDSTCKRPECDIDSYINKVKRGISPLINLRLIDVSDPSFEKRTKDLDINMLPTFAFNKTVEKLGNFDQLKDNFLSSKSGTYLLQFPPYRVLEIPNQDAQLLYGDGTSDVNIFAFLSLSTQQSIDTLNQLEQINKSYRNANVYLKYFYRNETDEKIVISLECASRQDGFSNMLTQIKSNNSAISSANVDRFRVLLNNYVRNAGLNANDFFSCYDENNQEILDRISNSKLEIANFGVVGAPTVLINQKNQNSAGVVMGFYETEKFIKLVDDILNQEFNNL